MEYFQFLKNSVESPTRSEQKGEHSKNKIESFINGRTPNRKEKRKSDNRDENKAYLRNGLKIRVIHKPGSRLNYYKGYIGEIKYYKSPNDYALVVLWAMNSLNQIRMPVDHFQIMDD